MSYLNTHYSINIKNNRTKNLILTGFLTLFITPIIIYNNADTNKDLPVKQNRGKSGIYRWVHIESGKSYIGSSIDLSKRFSQYFNYNHISNPKHKMAIYKAILTYGYTAFRLEILEYCPPEILIEREQFYLDKFKPEYNILKVAGSSFGFKHSEATRELMSKIAKDRKFYKETLLKMKEPTLSEEVKLRISAATKCRKLSQETHQLISKSSLGHKHTKDTLLKMALNNNKRQPIVLTNLNTGTYKEFPFMKEAAKYLDTSHTQIRNYLIRNKPYKGYKISLGMVKK